MTMKFLHITDTHLVAPGKQLHGLDPHSRLNRCIDSVNTHHADADCCVITGDLAERGEPEAYDLLASALRDCAVPSYLLIGNHDDRSTFTRLFPDSKTDTGPYVQSHQKTAAGVFLLLDTVKEGTHAGSYCEERCQWLRHQLNVFADDPVFIFMHHPPFDIFLPGLDKIGLENREAFSAALKTHSNVRHIFFGHAHRPLSGNWRGISFSSLRGINHQIALNFTSSELEYIDEPPEYSIVFVDDDKIVVHTHTY